MRRYKYMMPSGYKSIVLCKYKYIMLCYYKSIVPCRCKYIMLAKLSSRTRANRQPTRHQQGSLTPTTEKAAGFRGARPSRAAFHQEGGFF
jgi:hypothetical protein